MRARVELPSITTPSPGRSRARSTGAQVLPTVGPLAQVAVMVRGVPARMASTERVFTKWPVPAASRSRASVARVTRPLVREAATGPLPSSTVT